MGAIDSGTQDAALFFSDPAFSHQRPGKIFPFETLPRKIMAL